MRPVHHDARDRRLGAGVLGGIGMRTAVDLVGRLVAGAGSYADAAVSIGLGSAAHRAALVHRRTQRT